MNAIDIKELHFAYKGGSPTLCNINLTIAQGEFASIVGPNGGGKTTLLKLIMGLLTPDQGTVQILEESPEKNRLSIGYIPQYFNIDLKFPITVGDVVLTGRQPQTRILGGYTKEDRQKMSTTLERLSLLEHKDQLFSSLSGGQKRRVMIARALVSSPKILVLDEPTANIDIPSEHRLYEILNELGSTMTLLMVSHDLHFVSRLATKVICVNRHAVIHRTEDMVDPLTGKFHGDGLKMVFHGDDCC